MAEEKMPVRKMGWSAFCTGSEGIAIKFDDINRIADHAYMKGTGATYDDVLEKFYDPQWEEEARASVA